MGFTVYLNDERETARLAETLALAMQPGDWIGLSGTLGAGKSSFARAFIRHGLDDPHAEVPSPTFTLVQLYEGGRFDPMAHLDLYRLGDGEELLELGLEEALETGVALVEWPERGEGYLPPASFHLHLEQGETDEARTATITGAKEQMERLERSLEIRVFLDAHGHHKSSRHFLTGDASARAYETIRPSSGDELVLMNAPTMSDEPVLEKWGHPYSQVAHLAEGLGAFVGVAEALAQKGLAVPALHQYDLDAGLLLLDHLGSNGIIDAQRQPMEERYRATMDLLAHMHTMDWDAACAAPKEAPHTIPPYDRTAMLVETDLLAQWYAPWCLGRPLHDEEQNQFETIWNGLIDHMAHAPKTLVLRDYHSPNIIWRGDEEGHDRVGLIDFQDALIGPAAYDVASLAQDARVDVPVDVEQRLLARYINARGDDESFDPEIFMAQYAIMAALRATKILGIFIRLSQRDGKHAYMAHLPRMQHYLQRALKHEVLADYADWVNTVLVKPKAG
ncbi:MAG: tRNA (adenosine(37)-N6)-threonylcarbamoyltransferase complex ATPase subunit type 1 TsaE [Pseudomonadota bacterium]